MCIFVHIHTSKLHVIIVNVNFHLQYERSKLFGDLADHSLRVLTVLLPYPGIG